MVPLIVVIVLLVIGFVAWKALSSKSGGDVSSNATATPYVEPASPAAEPVQPAAQPIPTAQPMPTAQPTVQTYAAPAQPIQTQPAPATVQPVGTPRLDEPDAVRPDIDMNTLAAARTAVANVGAAGAAVPEAVLADALLDATPDQLRQMFSSVPQDVLHQVVDAKDNVQQPLKHEETAQLKGMADSLDDLDIWSFGETKA